MRTVKPWWIVAGLLAGSVVVAAWHAYANDPGDTSWTDPHQPPTMLAPMVARPRSGRILRGEPYSRSYPDTLSSWDGSVLGDI